MPTTAYSTCTRLLPAAAAAILLLGGFVPASARRPTAESAGMMDVYVSQSGSDSNDGSSAHPLATLEKARQATEGKAPATVHIETGTYYLPEPLVLTAADGGVNWVGDGAGSTFVRGGKLVVGWEQHTLPHLPSQPLWRARNPFPGEPIYQLIEGRAPATLARHPDRGAGWLYNWTSTTVAGRPY